MAQANKERRKQIIELVQSYSQPITLNEFVRTHIESLGLKNDYRSRNILSAFLYNMVRRGELAMVRRKGTPFIFIPGRDVQSAEDLISDNKEGSGHLSGTLNARQQLILEYLARFKAPVRLSRFVKDHLKEWGYSADARGRNAANVYLYEMIDRGLIKKTKQGHNTYIMKSEYSGIGVKAKSKQQQEGEKNTKSQSLKPLVRTQKTPQIREKKHLLPLEVILEAKSSLELEDYELDQTLDKIVKRKIEIRLELARLSSKLHTMFQA
ncbi:hypothetical protein JXQ70_15610 [bacterium]|nr:hypothetical protein [bacterium]